MDLGLSEHPVVVIGGSSGIGLACARQFASEGAAVSIWDVQPPPDDAVPDHAAGFRPVDITSLDDLQQALATTTRTLGPVQHVVNAAAVGSGKFGFPFTSLQPADWRRVLEVNVQGLTNLAHVLTPVMMAAGQGTFVLIASVAGQIGSPTDPPYSASKAANINFAQVMAKDLADHGIRVNTVCPGMVQTPLNRAVWQSWNERQSPADRLSYDAWAKQKIAQLVPLGRWQTPDDIAHMVVFLSSDKASQVTGQTINVDGGYVMHS